MENFNLIKDEPREQTLKKQQLKFQSLIIDIKRKR